MVCCLWVETFSQPSSHGPLLAESEQQILRDLMSDAMEEIETHQTSAVKIEPNGKNLLGP